MSYLSLMRHSPLGGLLEHVFDAAQGDGDWTIPLQLTIPLRRVRDTSVRGTINFHDGRITPLAGMTTLAPLTGSLILSEAGLAASHVKARFMGGPCDHRKSVASGKSGTVSVVLGAR